MLQYSLSSRAKTERYNTMSDALNVQREEKMLWGLLKAMSDSDQLSLFNIPTIKLFSHSVVFTNCFCDFYFTMAFGLFFFCFSLCIVVITMQSSCFILILMCYCELLCVVQVGGEELHLIFLEKCKNSQFSRDDVCLCIYFICFIIISNFGSRN